MKIEFTARQTTVPPEIRRMAQRKLEKLARLLPGMTGAHVIVTQDKHRHVAEVSLNSPRLKLTAQDEGNDLGASLTVVIERLARRAQRQRARRREKRRAPRAASTAPRGTAARARARSRGRGDDRDRNEPEA
jgi:putative sigma-54 modulation protein